MRASTHTCLFQARRRALLCAAMVASAGALLAPPPARAGAGLATMEVQLAGAAGQWRLDGVLQPLRQATLAAQVGAGVLALAVQAGDRVKAGQLLARLDERDAQAALLRGEAGVSQAEAELRNARVAAERSRALRDQGFVSQAALDNALTQWQAAQAALQQAQAACAQAALARGFTAVTAPFDAVVLATHVEAGDLATPGRAIATVYAPGAMRAVVQLPASLAAAARGAQALQVVLADGRRLTPVASTLLPGADAVSQTVEWRLELPPRELAAAPVLPGQALQVQWQAAPGAATAAPAVPVLPASALLRRGELTAVYVAQGGRFVLRAVRAGATRGAGGEGGVEVLAGLKPGERVARDAVAAGLAGALPAP